MLMMLSALVHWFLPCSKARRSPFLPFSKGPRRPRLLVCSKSSPENCLPPRLVKKVYEVRASMSYLKPMRGSLKLHSSAAPFML